MTVYLHWHSVAIAEVLACFVAVTVKLVLEMGPGTLSGRQVAPQSVPVASRERLGSTTGRPRHAPGAPRASPMAPRDVKKTAQGLSGARRGHQNRRRIVLGCEKIEFS